MLHRFIFLTGSCVLNTFSTQKKIENISECTAYLGKKCQLRVEQRLWKFKPFHIEDVKGILNIL
jgi:hypothetical protein